MAELTEIEIAKSIRANLKRLKDEDAAAAIEAEKRKAQIDRLTTAFEAYRSFLDEIAGEDDDFEYPDNGTWKERIVAYLKYKNRVLKAADFFESFKKYEKDETKLRTAISNELSKMGTDGELKQYKPTDMKVKGYYYGNPAWFTGDVLKEEYKPQEKKQSLF